MKRKEQLWHPAKIRMTGYSGLPTSTISKASTSKAER
jgi:hypothetical protein